MNPDIEKLLRPHYISLQGYVSAGMESDKAAEKIFLNANENPYSLHDDDSFKRYPEPQPQALRDGYASLYGCSSERIIMTRGADEAIAVLTKLFCAPKNDAILTCPPCFGMYKVNAHAAPSREVIAVPLIEKDGAFSLDVDGVLERAKDAKLIFLCSPNNPTANSFPFDDIERIIKGAAGKAMVVLDETYIEFADAQSFTTKLEEYSNLIILRTLSKSYAMAGMRMGSMICGDTDLAALIRTKGMDAYPLPQASIDAALHVMKPEVTKRAHDNITKILAERTRMETALMASQHVDRVYPSDANFLLVKMPRCQDFLKACTAQNIIIRDFSDKEGTESCVRLSIGLPEENDKVLQVLNTL